MGIFESFIQAVNKEYDRRIRRSSEIIAYGMKHGHGHGHGHDHAHGHSVAQAPSHTTTSDVHQTDGAEEEDEGATVISNVPPGARVAGRNRPASTKQHDDTAR